MSRQSVTLLYVVMFAAVPFFKASAQSVSIPMAKVDELLKSLPSQPLYKQVLGPYKPQLIAGFKAEDRENAVYEYTLDFDTGKLLSVMAIGEIKADLSRSYPDLWALYRSDPIPTSRVQTPKLEAKRDQQSGEIRGGMIEAFEEGLAKYHEWAAKAQDMQPPPFTKEIPISRQYGEYWPQFSWTNVALPHLARRRAKPEDPNRAYLDIIFVPRRADLPPMTGSPMLSLEPGDVALLEGALRMRAGPVEYLNKMTEAIRQVTEEQKKSVQDAFN